MPSHARLIKSLLILSLGFLVPAASLAQEESAYIRLGTDIVPTFQSINLRADADKDDYSGSVDITLRVDKKVETFHFHNEGPTLTSFSLRGEAGPIEAAWEQVDPHTVRVTPTEKLDKGEYHLAIEFTNEFDTQAVSLYRMEYESQGYAFTQFEADDARGAFPCWDEPQFKIPFQLTLSVPRRHLAVSNTPVESESSEAGWTTYVFKRTQPMPTYLLALATGPLEATPMTGLDMPAAIYTVKGQRHLTGAALEMTPPILSALEAYFGSDYPYEKCDFIAIPEYWPGAMEHPGAVTYADRILLLDPDQTSLSQRRTLARIISHELAHMWFGNLVTMQWWDDLWLNESFADWMGDKIAHQVFPGFDQDISTVKNALGVMGGDAMATSEPIRRPINNPENLMEGVGLAYNKGKAVLAMFEAWAGANAFQEGVRGYIEEFAWGNAEAKDLWKALDKSSGKKISKGLSTFIEQPGLPLIRVEIDGNKLKITQERFRNYQTQSEDLQWSVPVGLKVGMEGMVHTETVFLDGKDKTVKLDGQPYWVYPNLGARGYYRWEMPVGALQSLSEGAVEQMTAVERVEILGNLSALLQAGFITGDTYLSVLPNFAQDPEPLVITSVISALNGVKMAFVPAELEEDFAAYIQRTLGPAAERFGLEARPGEDETVSLLRPQLIEILGVDGRDDSVRKMAENLAKNYMRNPTGADPAIISTALRIAAMNGNEALYNTYRQQFETTEIPTDRRRYLAALGSFQDAAIREQALAYSLEGPLRPQELFAIGQAVASSAEGRDRLFEWMTENYDTILSKVPPMFASFMPVFAGGCSAERLATAQAFFGDPARATDAASKQLAKVSEQVNDCVGLREREGAAVAAYLRSGGGEP